VPLRLLPKLQGSVAFAGKSYDIADPLLQKRKTPMKASEDEGYEADANPAKKVKATPKSKRKVSSAFQESRICHLHILRRERLSRENFVTNGF
jgi:hypothetical protein